MTEQAEFTSAEYKAFSVKLALFTSEELDNKNVRPDVLATSMMLSIFDVLTTQLNGLEKYTEVEAAKHASDIMQDAFAVVQNVSDTAIKKHSN